MKKWKSKKLIHVSLTSQCPAMQSHRLMELDERIKQDWIRIICAALVPFSRSWCCLNLLQSSTTRSGLHSCWNFFTVASQSLRNDFFLENSISNCLRHKLRILLFAVIVMKEKERKGESSICTLHVFLSRNQPNQLWLKIWFLASIFIALGMIFLYH